MRRMKQLVISPEDIVQQIKDEEAADGNDRKPVSIYLSKKGFSRFKATCESDAVKASKVIEKLMDQYSSAKGKKI